MSKEEFILAQMVQGVTEETAVMIANQYEDYIYPIHDIIRNNIKALEIEEESNETV